MYHSEERILTTHVGSLIRSPKLAKTSLSDQPATLGSGPASIPWSNPSRKSRPNVCPTGR